MHEGPLEGALLDRQDANWESLNDKDLREAVRRITLGVQMRMNLE